MDTVSFRIERTDTPAWGIIDAANIFVNGRNLVDMVREVELPFAAREGNPHLAGDYVGLPVEAVLFPSRRLLGEPETYYDTDYLDGKLAVLGCGCGEVGCWPLRVRISAMEGQVTWGDFEQPHRRRWDHGALGPFVFDRGEYEAALQGAPEGR